jgi:hypothetical protein
VLRPQRTSVPQQQLSPKIVTGQQLAVCPNIKGLATRIIEVCMVGTRPVSRIFVACSEDMQAVLNTAGALPLAAGPATIVSNFHMLLIVFSLLVILQKLHNFIIK